SRTQFHRLFRTVVQETRATIRRGLLLLRAAHQLAHTGMSVTDVVLVASYGSLEELCRALRRAFRFSHSLDRRMRYALIPFPTVRMRQGYERPSQIPPHPAGDAAKARQDRC